MGVLAIRCPETGCSFETQYEADQEWFATTPVFLARSYCRFRRAEHRWFAQDASVVERAPFMPNAIGRSRASLQASTAAESRKEPIAMTLDEFVRSNNIARFRRLLATSKDEAQRKMTAELLNEELAKQRQAEANASQ